MEATRLQMQNFLIFLLDLVGVTVGYFAAVWLRFGNIETGYTVMGNDTYYRWLIAIVVLMMIYFLFRPNRGFFKRKFIEEMRMNLQTVPSAFLNESKGDRKSTRLNSSHRT